MHKRLFAVLLLLSALGFAGALDELQKNISEFTLSNGLKVIVYEDHMAPVFSAVTYADVGSVNEHVGITGLAHIFEHMAFKGTSVIGATDWGKEKVAIEKEEAIFLALREERNKGPLADPEKLKRLEGEFKAAKEASKALVEGNAFARIVEREGCEGLNASTSFDQTQYYYNFPSNKIELWAYMESERFLDPSLREFHTELEVISEERRMGIESQPTGRLFEEFLGAAYLAHPYSVFVIGHMSDIQNMSRADAMEFYRTYYIPRNLVVAVAGDVYPEKLKPVMEKYFGRLEDRPLPPGVTTIEPPQRGERRIKIKDPSQPFLVFGYHKGAFNDPDDPVFSAITDIMGEGRTSRLYRRLVRDEKLALAAAAFTGLPGNKFPGLFIFYSVPMQGKTNAENEQAILEEIEKLKSEPVTAEELQRVKTRAKAELIRSMQDPTGIAVQLAFYEKVAGGWQKLFTQLDRIDKVTADDIMRVAKQYFTEANRTVAEIEHVEEGGAK
jgi:predicted Zn-dependent peptidase